ncbi:MAG: FAD-dependent oxidoreductase [Spirochaetaceae bacterium]|jgi:NAD(P)H-nitrite reductase large subunit|nr:FAD-dependent oxidoreductase [Spirochaetaceae bacterium]
MKHLIIGAGAAGISAARRILKEQPQDGVIIVSEDAEVYSRCMLHKFIGGKRDAASINFINDDLLSHPNVRWIGGKTITRLDAAAKTVYAGDEAVASGDTVLIATGAVSVTPPIGELKTAKNVFGLRHLSDARAIAEKARNASRIAVIGAGLVGLDAVYGILEQAEQTGKKPRITVIEMAPAALAINLDAHAAEAYQRLFEARGVTFLLGSKVIDTKGDGNGNITSVELEGGTSVPCDMAVLAVGVRPAVAFLDGAGVELTERRAVKVDDYLETSVPGIYAAGDAAGLSGIWPNAQKQGEFAAYNMTGTRWAYDDRFAIKNTVNFFGLLSLSLGAINPAEGDEVLIKEDRNNYKKLILRGGVPAGIILQGDIGGTGFWLHLIKNKIRIDTRGKSPWKISYADFYGVETNGEYRWVV